MLSRLSIAALWSPAGKGLNSWLLFVMSNCVFITFQCGILGQMWYLIVSIPDLCCLSYFVGWYFSFFIQILKETSVSKQWRSWSDAAFCGV